MKSTSTHPVAIISDIHGNLDALAAVLKDVAAHECITMVCLGDIVGYGPEPGACVQLVREYASAVVIGNHEAMLLAILKEGSISREKTGDMWKALALCRKGLRSDEKRWIRKLPFTVIAQDLSFVHGSLHQPHEFNYIRNKEDARLTFAAQETPLSFHGHTHVPVVWEEKGKEITGYVPGDGEIQLDPDCRYAVCVGSVGQPRDRDPRASYALYDLEKHRLVIRRLEYDIKRARERFLGADLKGFHAMRLANGV
ncbi:MAG: metallophosphoesterase family protein [Chthoniobacterales bacterium]